MYCSNCGEKLGTNQAVCLKCGVKVGEGKNYCHSCGEPVANNAAVCLKCGVALRDSGIANDLNGKDKITMALVCFFLGGLGIHNFMMGESKKGVAKILLSLLCGIGFVFALVDLVKILTDKYVCDSSKYF